jgi:hypothetical protein
MQRILIIITLTMLIFSCETNSSDNSSDDTDLPNQETYIEFHEGNLPIILEAPHGGSEMLEFISPNPVLGGRDTGTLELTRFIRQRIVEITGKSPYVIAMLANRNYIEANYSAGETAYTTEYTKTLYELYYSKIEFSIESVAEDFGAGLMISIHSGWNYPYEFDIGVNARDVWSTIPVFIERHGWDTFHGIDGVAERLYLKGYAAPGFGDVEFSNGYAGNPILTYCRKESNIGVDGFQFEFRGSQFLYNDEERQKLANDVAEVLIEFVDSYYIDIQ